MSLFARIIPVIIALSVSSCATYNSGRPSDGPALAQERFSHKERQTASTPDYDRSVSYHKFTLGLLAEKRGEYGEAVKFYYQSAVNDKGQVQAYTHAAGLYLKLGDLKMAASAAKSGLKIDPNNSDCLKILGGIYFSQHESEKAIQYFERLVAIDDNSKDGMLYLAVSYLEAGLINKSIDLLIQFNEKFPHFSNGHYYLGRGYMRLGDWEKAEKVFKDLLEKRPDFHRVHPNLAWIYRVSGRPGKAIGVYDEYLKINPNDKYMQSQLEETISNQKSGDNKEIARKQLMEKMPKSINLQFTLGLSAWRQAEMTGDIESFHRALDHFQLLSAGSPQNRKIVFYVANIFERLGLLSEAIETWKQIGNSKSSPLRDVNVKIAELYERSGKPEKSLEYAIKASEASPDDPELRYFIGLLYNKLNENKKAESYFKEAIRLKPKDEKYYFYLGVVYEKMKIHSKTIDAMIEAIAIKPNHPNALNYLGYIYAEQNIHLDKAEKHLMDALTIEPDNGYFIDSLGWIYYKQKRYKKALSWILSAVRNIPPDPTVLEHLGDVYVALGKPASAIEAYERSLNAKAEDDRKLDRGAIREKMADIKKSVKQGETK